MADLGVIADDPVEPSPGVDRGTLLHRFDSTSIGDLLDVAGPGSGTPVLGASIRHLGGALTEEPATAAAAGAIDEPYLLFSIGIPGLGGATVDDLNTANRGIADALGDAATGRSVYNFLGPSGPERAYDVTTLGRLRTLKERHDPAGRFRMTRRLPG